MFEILQTIRLAETISKIKTIVLSFLLLSLFYDISPTSLLHTLIFSFLILTYIYIINDFFDKDVDRHSNKKKILYGFEKKHMITLLAFMFSISILHYLIFFNLNPKSIASLILLVSIGTLYSSPPLRFKTRGFLGILFGSLTQRMLVFLTIAFGLPLLIDFRFIAYFSIVGLLLDMIVLIGHQMEDRATDISAGIRTWVSTTDERGVRTVLIILIALYLTTTLLWLPLAFPGKRFYMLVLSLLYLVLNIQAIHIRHLDRYWSSE